MKLKLFFSNKIWNWNSFVREYTNWNSTYSIYFDYDLNAYSFGIWYIKESIALMRLEKLRLFSLCIVKDIKLY